MNTNYPFPTDINGNRLDLVKSYKRLVSKNKGKNYPGEKKPNTIRICCYNVNSFQFLYNSNERIYEFIKQINPDVLSMIEYANYPNDNHFYKTNSKFTFLQQKENYGILTMTPLEPNFLLEKYMHTNLICEKTGITHCSINNINIITVHLDVFIESGRMRLHEILDIHDYIISNGLINVLLIGDFNEMNIDETHPMYEEYRSEFQSRTGYTTMPTLTHDFLKKLKYLDVFTLYDEGNLYPKFSCWSGKLVDYCYIWLPTWDNNIKIADINIPMFQYSDHLPLVVDVKLADNLDEEIYVNTYLDNM